MTDLVKRTYRVHKNHDKKVKSLSRRSKKTESQIVREAIEEKMQ